MEHIQMSDQKLDKIVDELRTLNLEFKQFSAKQEEMCKTAECQRQTHHKTLYGNGNGERGLTYRVQSLEGKAALILVVLVTAMTGIVGTGAWEFIKKIITK